MRSLGWFLPLFSFGLLLLLTGSKAEVKSGASKLSLALDKGRTYVFRAEVERPDPARAAKAAPGKEKEGDAPVQVDESAAKGQDEARGSTTEEKIQDLAGEAKRLRALEEYRLEVQDISPSGHAKVLVKVARAMDSKGEAGDREDIRSFSAMIGSGGRIESLAPADGRKDAATDDLAAVRAHLEGIFAPGLRDADLEIGKVYELSKPDTRSGESGEKAKAAPHPTPRLRYEGSGKHAGVRVARFTILAPEAARRGRSAEDAARQPIEEKPLGEAHYGLEDGVLRTMSLRGHSILAGSAEKVEPEDVVILRRVEE